IILACRALGLGTVITTNHLRIEAEFKALLGIPDDVDTFALMPIGWPEGRFGLLSRRPLADVVHADHWSGAWPGWPAQVAATALTRTPCQICAITAATTTVPPAKLAADGASPNAIQTHATASGASSVLRRAFSVAEIHRPPIVSKASPSPNWVVPNK